MSARRPRRRGRWLTWLSPLLCSSPAWAQSTAVDPRLIPGSSDTIHDAAGIAIGMTCDQARAVGRKISAQRGPLNAGPMRGTVRHKGERNGVSYEYHTYQVPLNLINGGIVTDMLTFSCLDEGRSGVFEIVHSIRFGAYDVGDALPMAALRAMFQEKYGVPTVEFSPYSFATLFDRSGAVSDKDACGLYQNGYLYLQDFGMVDPDRCSYALTFEGRPLQGRPGAVGSLVVMIRDYLRLQEGAKGGADERAKHILVATPKL